jgi:hypothetical protein
MFWKEMRETNAPYALWDHCIQFMAETRSNTALDLFTLEGDTPVTKHTGATNYISHLCEFSWYDPVWFIDVTDPRQNKKLERYLGPNHDVGQAMYSKVLTPSCRIIRRTSVIPLTEAKRNNPIIRDEYDKTLKLSLGDRAAGINLDLDQDEKDERVFIPYADDSISEEVALMTEADDFDHDSYHKFISA